MKERLTYKDKITYNKGEPIRCDCGKIIGYRVKDKVFIFCRSCKKQIDVSAKSR